MQLSKIPNLTDTDIKLLLSLVEKQTRDEVARSTGVPFHYVVKRTTYLTSKNYLEQIREGKTYLYQTKRLPETEQFFNIHETATGERILHRINFLNQYLTYGEAAKFLGLRRDKIAEGNLTLLEIIKYCLAVISVRSHRKSKGLDSQQPDEETMRAILERHILVKELELELAKKLYNTKFLWTGDQNIWKTLSDKEPTEGLISVYNDAFKRFV